MFDYTLLHWTTFFAAVILLELSPGPDMAFMLGQTIRNGRKAGFAALVGSLVATCFHVALAALGLSAVVATSAVAFSIVKWVGVIYLIWLGVRAFVSSDGSKIKEDVKSTTARSAFLQGMLICLFNPKVAIFFLAFLPQFVVESAGPVSLQLLLHGSLLIVVGLMLQTPLILAGAQMTSAWKEDRRLRKWIDRGLGAMFFTLGYRLAISESD